MASSKFSSMDDEKFMKEWTKAADEFQKAKDLVSEFSKENQRREAEKQAVERYEAMNDAERAALAQVIEARGIESEEKVNENG